MSWRCSRRRAGPSRAGAERARKGPEAEPRQRGLGDPEGVHKEQSGGGTSFNHLFANDQHPRSQRLSSWSDACLPHPELRQTPGRSGESPGPPKQRPRSHVSPGVLAPCCWCHVAGLRPASPASPELLPKPHKRTVVAVCGGTLLPRASSTHTCSPGRPRRVIRVCFAASLYSSVSLSVLPCVSECASGWAVRACTRARAPCRSLNVSVTYVQDKYSVGIAVPPPSPLCLGTGDRGPAQGRRPAQPGFGFTEGEAVAGDPHGHTRAPVAPAAGAGPPEGSGVSRRQAAAGHARRPGPGVSAARGPAVRARRRGPGARGGAAAGRRRARRSAWRGRWPR